MSAKQTVDIVNNIWREGSKKRGAGELVEETSSSIIWAAGRLVTLEQYLKVKSEFCRHRGNKPNQPTSEQTGQCGWSQERDRAGGRLGSSQSGPFSFHPEIQVYMRF